MSIELFNYQKEFVNATEDKIVCNWARGMGEDFSLLIKILKEKPKIVVDDTWLHQKFLLLEETIKEIKNMDKEYNDLIKNISVTKNKIIIEYSNNKSTVIYYGDITKRLDIKKSDWEIHFKSKEKNSTDAKKTFYMINENNYDRHLQKDLKLYRFIEADYNTGIDVGQLSNSYINKIKSYSDIYSFCKEFAIFDNPNEIKKDFFEKQLESLEHEFKNLGNTSNTVLTRQNLLKMILDIKHEINK